MTKLPVLNPETRLLLAYATGIAVDAVHAVVDGFVCAGRPVAPDAVSRMEARLLDLGYEVTSVVTTGDRFEMTLIPPASSARDMMRYEGEVRRIARTSPGRYALLLGTDVLTVSDADETALALTRDGDRVTITYDRDETGAPRVAAFRNETVGGGA